MSATTSTLPTLTETPTTVRIDSFRTSSDPVRLVIPIGLLVIVVAVVAILRVKSRAKVRADGQVPLAAEGNVDSRGWTARVKVWFASISTAISTPFTSLEQWKADQLTLQSEEGKWGSGHGIVTLESTVSVPRTLEAGVSADPVAAAPVVDTIEVLEVVEPPSVARTPWERLFRR
jgi:hypothetical protein